MTRTKKRRGRPPKPQEARLSYLSVGLTQPLRAALQEYAKAQDLSESAGANELIWYALARLCPQSLPATMAEREEACLAP